MDIDISPAPLPLPKTGHLDSILGIRRELGKIYRDMRRKRLDCADGTKLVFVLMSMAKLLEKSAFDERLAELSDRELLVLIDNKIRDLELRTPRHETLNGTRPPS